MNPIAINEDMRRWEMMLPPGTTGHGTHVEPLPPPMVLTEIEETPEEIYDRRFAGTMDSLQYEELTGPEQEEIAHRDALKHVFDAGGRHWKKESEDGKNPGHAA